MTINNKSERHYRGKCLGWLVTSYGAEYMHSPSHVGFGSTSDWLKNSKCAVIGRSSS